MGSTVFNQTLRHGLEMGWTKEVENLYDLQQDWKASYLMGDRLPYKQCQLHKYIYIYIHKRDNFEIYDAFNTHTHYILDIYMKRYVHTVYKNI